jgi:hypothetical protein
VRRCMEEIRRERRERRKGWSEEKEDGVKREGGNEPSRSVTRRLNIRHNRLRKLDRVVRPSGSEEADYAPTIECAQEGEHSKGQ